MARFLLIVAVCYCAYCAQLALGLENAMRREHIEENVDSNVDRFENTANTRNVIQQSDMSIEFAEMNVPKKLRGRRKTASDVSHMDNNSPFGNEYDEFSSGEYLARTKRHAGGHGHAKGGTTTDNARNDELAAVFVRKLFEQFGDGDKQTMNALGFEKMLKHLGLYRLLEDGDVGDLGAATGVDAPAPTSSNEECLSSIDLISRVSSMTHADLDNSTKLTENRTQINSAAAPSNSTSLKDPAATNLTTSNQTTLINSIKENLFLKRQDLWSICPIILYQLTASSSLERSGCIDPAWVPADTNHHHHTLVYAEESRTLVWVYATLSIIGASLCGLLGVAVIPCMDRHYYQHVLQFFVALAIGTLAGDALLHLLPHAMMTFSLDEDGHNSMTWKGLVSTLGIIFFFLTERLLTMIAEWRKTIQKRDDPPGKVRVMRDPDSVSVSHSLNGEKQCKHKYSSYPYCYDEIAMDTKDDHHHHHHHSRENGVKTGVASSPKSKAHARNSDDVENMDGAQSLLAPPSNYTISGSAYLKNGEKTDAETPGNHTVLTNLDVSSVDSCGCEPKKADENFTIILREHESKHHGHSHTHGHVHSPPKTLSSVAWMVVMGDGLHNFTDGMAIGAAFSSSIAGGFSTAIAVFCHELPHELGDFAVLLKAGMSARKAVYYNVLSSVLSLLGMILGIIFGDTPEASAWIFSAAAGMFIYIALVDMMPELTTAHNESCAVTQLLLQSLGMFIGVGIMLVIALFEGDLKVLFTPGDSHHEHHYHH